VPALAPRPLNHLHRPSGWHRGRVLTACSPTDELESPQPLHSSKGSKRFNQRHDKHSHHVFRNHYIVLLTHNYVLWPNHVALF
jgi:hypothetical protein